MSDPVVCISNQLLEKTEPLASATITEIPSGMDRIEQSQTMKYETPGLGPLPPL